MAISGVMIMTAAVAISSYQEPAAGLKRFSSAAGGFEISLPGEPKEEVRTTKTANGEIKIFNLQLEREDGVYMVAYSNHPESQERTVGADAMLEAGVKGMLQATESTLLTKKSITQDGFPGREITYTMKGPGPNDKAHGRAKFVLVNGRMYQVVIVGSETMAKSATADAVFASFKLKPGRVPAAKTGEMKAAAAGAKSTAEFATFSSPAGRFEVSLPGEPAESKNTIKTAAGNIQVVTYEVNHVDGQYIIGTSDYPEKLMRTANVDQGLEGSQNGIVTSAKGKLLGSKKIKQDGFPGLEFTYSLNSPEIGGKAIGRVRLFLVNSRLYQVFVIAEETKVRSAANDAFFESFKFEPGAAAEKPVAAATPKRVPTPRARDLRKAAPERAKAGAMPRGPAARRGVAKRSETDVDPASWKAWTLEKGGASISIRVPSDPTRRQESGIFGKAKREVFTWSAGDAEFTLRSQTIPKATLADGPKSVLDASRDALMKETKGRARDERNASVDDNPALEFQIQAASLRGRVIRVRSVVVGNQLYEQYMTASRADIAGDAAGRFFGSFKLDK
jgi:hypothetical protein